MNVQLLFGAGVAFGLIAWGVFSALYLWPQLDSRSRNDALRPLLMLHGFRFIGLSFLVPGVVASDLPMTFARDAAFGDLAAAVLALLALVALRSRWGIGLAWVFNVWGPLDLLNAFYQAGASGLSPGQFGAAYFLPTFIVPFLLITHGLIFRILLKPDQADVDFGRPRSSYP